MNGKKQPGASAADPASTAQNNSARQDMLDLILKSSSTAVIVTDMDSCRLLYVNPQAMTIMGASGDYTGMTCRDYFGCTEETCRHCAHSTGEGEDEIQSRLYIKEQGRHLAVDSKLRKLGERRVLVKFFRDVTEKHEIEAELRAREQMLSAVLEQSGLNYWEYYMNEDRVVSSDVSIKSLGIPGTLENFPESFIAQGILLPKYVEQYRRLHEDIKSGVPTEIVEQCIRRSDGSIMWQRVRYDTIFDDDGRPVKAMASCIDITREKELQERYDDMLALQDINTEKAVASFLVDLTNDCIRSVKDSDKSITALRNCPLEALVELVSSRIPNRSQQEEFRRVTDRKRLLWLFQKQGVIEQSTVFSYVTDSARPTRWLEISANLTLEPSSGDVMMYCCVNDVTIRTVREQLYSLMGESYAQAMLYVDLRTTDVSIFVPKRGLSEHYASYDEFMSVQHKYLQAHGYKPPEDDIIAALSLDNICARLEHKKEYEVTIRLCRSAGETMYLKAGCCYMDDEKSGLAMIFTDITESFRQQQRQHARLESALLEAERATRAKSEFLSSVSHDMRTPMNGILGLANLTLAMEGLPEEAGENLQNLLQSSRFLLQLINDTLDMSKIESSKIELAPQPTKCATILKNVVALVMPSITEKHLNLIVRKNSELENTVMVDRIRMEQIMMNLLSNAVKFTPAGGNIEVNVESTGVENGVSHCVITVKDSGCGMSEEFLPHLFEPFSQENSDPDRSLYGTGLGMPIVKNLVELMGGTIEAKSIPGEGTTFIIHMNLLRVEEEEPARAPAVQKLAENSLRGKRVLFAEDHPVNIIVGRKMLESKGIEVTHVKNGRLAAESFAASPEGYFDAVLMDILMPEMDGYGATAAIRSLKRADALCVPIIAMTANAFSEDVKKCLAAGMDAHLAKPVEPELLWLTLHEYISKRSDRS